MATKQAASIKQVAEMMRDLDFCMFTTTSAEGGLYGRPMSNNGEVEFDGDIWFFSGADTRKIREIKADPRVHLSYADPEQFRFISMTGTAEIVRDREKKRELWLDELKRWFKDGPDSPDVVLIKVRPTLVAYWTGEGDGEIKLD
jgi:general stress protein 26